ncbi:MAG: carbonic anhydrase [Alphaproteobacteria bacterium]
MPAPASSHGTQTASASQGAAPAHGTVVAAAASGGHASAWAYTGETGPDFWDSLKAEYGACGAGMMQSPINISGGMAVDASQIEFNYNVTELMVRNNGHTVQVDYNKGSYIVVNGGRFNLLQFHFHTPSEHLNNGKKFSVEMHLVHQNAADALAVVGVMMEMGENNIALGEVQAYLPETYADPIRISGVTVNARDLLPRDKSYNHYKGSLTTPPCSEGVNWYVLTNPIQVSAAQIAKFTAIMGDNARPAQSMAHRLVVSTK